MKEIAIAEFARILPVICDQETSQDQEGWTETNPLWGHCAAVSLVAQNLFGGQLLRASLEGTEFAFMRSHYWNRFSSGEEHDFTRPQFQGKRLGLNGEERTREYVLIDPKTKQPREIMERYKLLAFRLARAVYPQNPIFEDQIYKKCLFTALDSPCQKMKFGCVLVHRGEAITTDNNHFIEPLRSLCEPKCIRLSLQSRTESMLGACGHAEEFAIWEAIRRGIPLQECDIYIAGLYPNGLPWFKTTAEHTCLRCSVQMHYAKFRTIFVSFMDRWSGLNGEQAISGALSYAIKEKKV